VLLNHYVEQEIGITRLKGLEQHLKDCPLCRKELEGMRKTVKIIRAMEEVDLPRDYQKVLKTSLTEK
jgi:hypothetical protein